jgi:Phosphate transport (Pho88)
VQCSVRSYSHSYSYNSWKRKISVARKIPFDDPEVLTYVRISYVLSQVIGLRIYHYVSMAVRFLLSFSNELVNELVSSDQEKERPNGAQIRLASSLSARSLTNLPVSCSGACVPHGSFIPTQNPDPTPSFPFLQSGDQKGELVTTTVRDYDLSETPKLVRTLPSSLILLHSRSLPSSAPRTWVSP